MNKVFSFILILFVFFSCKEKRTEFIQSNAISSLILIKNPPSNDSLTKGLIRDFLSKNHTKDDFKMFYKYTSNTKSFIENERPGGYFREYLYHYPEDQIAVFSVSKCENDTTKLVGHLYFFNRYGSFFKPDTLIYNCK